MKPGRENLSARIAELVGQGESLIHDGETDRALDTLLEALFLDPENARILNDLGVALFLGGRSEEAAALFRAALDVEPDNQAAVENLCNLSLPVFDDDSADEVFLSHPPEADPQAPVQLELFDSPRAGAVELESGPAGGSRRDPSRGESTSDPSLPSAGRRARGEDRATPFAPDPKDPGESHGDEPQRRTVLRARDERRAARYERLADRIGEGTRVGVIADAGDVERRSLEAIVGRVRWFSRRDCHRRHAGSTAAPAGRVDLLLAPDPPSGPRELDRIARFADRCLAPGGMLEFSVPTGEIGLSAEEADRVLAEAGFVVRKSSRAWSCSRSVDAGTDRSSAGPRRSAGGAGPVLFLRSESLPGGSPVDARVESIVRGLGRRCGFETIRRCGLAEIRETLAASGARAVVAPVGGAPGLTSWLLESVDLGLAVLVPEWRADGRLRIERIDRLAAGTPAPAASVMQLPYPAPPSEDNAPR